MRHSINHLPKPKYLGANVKVELDLCNYATKADLKNGTRVDKLYFTKKTDLAKLDKLDKFVDKLDIHKFKNVRTYLSNLESKVDELDVDTLVPVPIDLSKLSDVVKQSC